MTGLGMHIEPAFLEIFVALRRGLCHILGHSGPFRFSARRRMKSSTVARSLIKVGLTARATLDTADLNLSGAQSRHVQDLQASASIMYFWEPCLRATPVVSGGRSLSLESQAPVI